MTVMPLGWDQDCSLKNREPDVPALLVPGSWRLEQGRLRLDCTSSSLESVPCPLKHFVGKLDLSLKLSKIIISSSSISFKDLSASWFSLHEPILPLHIRLFFTHSLPLCVVYNFPHLLIYRTSLSFVESFNPEYAAGGSSSIRSHLTLSMLLEPILPLHIRLFFTHSLPLCVVYNFPHLLIYRTSLSFVESFNPEYAAGGSSSIRSHLTLSMLLEVVPLLESPQHIIAQVEVNTDKSRPMTCKL
ncbi:hypothetical protein STEG23_010965, partial [Scotinomys teguina]